MKRRRTEDTPDIGSTDSNSGRSVSAERRVSKKKHKYRKRRSKHKHHRKDHRRRHRDEYESDSSRCRRDRKRRVHRSRNDSSVERNTKPRKGEKTRETDNEGATDGDDDGLVQALCSVLEERPLLSGDLPIMLIRMVGGATFDLQQMTDDVAARGLERVFESLSIHGVQKNRTNDLWMFSPPAGTNGRDELILLKVIRLILDELGVNMSAIQHYEHHHQQQLPDARSRSTKETNPASEAIKASTRTLLENFRDKDPDLGKQLIEISRTILSGESVCIDGLPNAHLRNSLGSILEQCGLEKSAMEYDDDSVDEEADGENALLGYGLPESGEIDLVKLKLSSFIETCGTTATQKASKRVVGPQLPPNDLNDDDEGPVPVGAASRGRVWSSGFQTGLQQQAVAGEGEREEWMLVPGKHDFLSSIKAGQNIKSRGFRNQKEPEADSLEEVNPEIQREMDSIMEAHKTARGPSLFMQHRVRKQQERDQASGKEAEWKWSRDSDLDAGRRVDKDALKMMLGGAATNLQSKFQGGFNK
eukprot:scaffold11924_cov118-Cylindrotheca_fusiformis.AAC.5